MPIRLKYKLVLLDNNDNILGCYSVDSVIESICIYIVLPQTIYDKTSCVECIYLSLVSFSCCAERDGYRAFTPVFPSLCSVT